MPYKRSPMCGVRVDALSRFVMSLDQNGTATCAPQWRERTLDDSANRQLPLPPIRERYENSPAAVEDLRV